MKNLVIIMVKNESKQERMKITKVNNSTGEYSLIVESFFYFEKFTHN